MTRGLFAYDYCDTGKMTPLAKMYTLGSGFIPSPNHAGGLRYHGMSPIVSELYHQGIIDEARALTQKQVFEAATLFAKSEGILPAPESSHAICAAIDEAVKCRETNEAKTRINASSRRPVDGAGTEFLRQVGHLLDGIDAGILPQRLQIIKLGGRIPHGDQRNFIHHARCLLYTSCS